MGLLLRLYINALLKGNPFVVGLTMIAAVAVCVGPLYTQLSSGDAWAIGFVVFVGACLALVLAVAIIDRRLNPREPKGRQAKGRSRRR